MPNEPNLILIQNMRDAIIAIDQVFGEGYAKANPVLVAAYMQADMTSTWGWYIQEQLKNVTDALIETQTQTQKKIEELTSVLGEAFLPDDIRLAIPSNS